ncbi:Putative Zinc finger C2H2-type [Septoria linicola]|uniref:Zinc finger C2H2-type n=1 Tax=Septoria linicola TaxID=215465 RepID=A0A9Q9AGU6_9PEZI|nr:putative Zinc finger C2H2-type [Septoria linicola]USW49159.1 Putative Zinc finger C2H2-type [Septoria linicola]
MSPQSVQNGIVPHAQASSAPAPSAMALFTTADDISDTIYAYMQTGVISLHDVPDASVQGHSTRGVRKLSHESVFACPHCQRQFALRKSLYRHIRTIHRADGPLEFPCFHCDHEFSRQDILVWHMHTQHGGKIGATVPCELCAKHVHPRSLAAHKTSAACRKAQRERLQVYLDGIDGINEGAEAANISYLPAIGDVIMLSAWLFIKFRPWGDQHRWMDAHHDPNKIGPHTSNEVLALRGLVYRQTIRALSASNIDRDSLLLDSLAILTMFFCQTEGWTAARQHTQAYVRLALMQLNALDNSRVAFTSVPAADTFRTVLLREAQHQQVPERAIDCCETLITKSLSLLREAAWDIIVAPL